MLFYSTRTLLLIFFISLFLFSCENIRTGNNSIAVEDDINIGKTIDEHILEYVNNSSYVDYLEPDSFTASYSYLCAIKNRIVNSDNHMAYADLSHTSNCSVNIRILDQAYTNSAFIGPGGYIYIFKNLLLDLQTEAQLTALMTHLVTCSANRISIPKLQNRFSPSFLIDLADGGDINMDVNLVLQELKDVAYDTSNVLLADIETENIVCELGYDIKSYSDLFNHADSKNLGWYTLFPRNRTEYASHLFNTVKNYPQCIDKELDGEAEYLNFKMSLN